MKATLLLTIFLFSDARAIFHRSLTVFADFNKEKDLTFFKNTFPWLIDNVGSDVNVYFHFKNSGRTSGPRNCALEELQRNVYLQADYLKCEAEGNSNTDCFKKFHIDSRQNNDCVYKGVEEFVRTAEREFSRLDTSETPVVVLTSLLRRVTIKNTDPKSLLNEICDFLSFRFIFCILPLGCMQPSPLPSDENKDKNTANTVSTMVEPSTKADKAKPTAVESIPKKDETNLMTNESTTKRDDNAITTTNIKDIKPTTIQSTTKADKIKP